MLSPVFFPIIRQLNIDPVYFGVVMCVTLMIGQLTPPVGIVSFAVVDAANVKLGPYLKELNPFLFVIIIALILIVVFPPFSSWLPGLIF
jgi:TRAP-type C4-dicarboxylate transport system permease large subunit